MTLDLYGISNCDTVRKARKWLEAQEADFRFHDFRKDGLSEDDLTVWIDVLGWETLLNRRSATWRKLPEGDRLDLDRDSAQALMLREPTLIKRPVLSDGHRVTCGFSEQAYRDMLD